MCQYRDLRLTNSDVPPLYTENLVPKRKFYGTYWLHLSSKVPCQEMDLRLLRRELDLWRIVPVFNVDTLSSVDRFLLRKASKTSQEGRLTSLTITNEKELYRAMWYRAMY